jgi:acyl-CoA synthetase (AMP-forming)/AMP-acid ligase II
VDPARVGALLESGTLAALFAPPTVIAKLSAALGERRFEGIRCLFTGTQALSPATYRKARAMFGPVVRITYGKSECTNPITVFPPLETERHFAQQAAGPGACVGWPVAGVEISIREGEVWLRAPHMYVGHLDESGFHALGEAEWHRTGDLGRVDEAGRLWLEARVADVIKSGGYKVLPDEIEALLAGVRGCGEICVTSLPSAYWGEVVVAVAEGASGAWQTEAAARLHALSRYKHPRVFVAVDALPRNAQGKVSRRELRQRLLARHELIDGPHPRLLERTLAGMPGTA